MFFTEIIKERFYLRRKASYKQRGLNGDVKTAT